MAERDDDFMSPDCYRCAEETAHLLSDPNKRMLLLGGRMYVCPTCGNKRCPKATDHRLGCTNSNEPGQAGSRYPARLIGSFPQADES